MNTFWRKAITAKQKLSQKKAMEEAYWVTLQTDWLLENRRILQRFNITI